MADERIVTGAAMIALLIAAVVIVLWWAGTRGLGGHDLVIARLDALRVGLSIGVRRYVSGGLVNMQLEQGGDEHWKRVQELEVRTTAQRILATHCDPTPIPRTTLAHSGTGSTSISPAQPFRVERFNRTLLDEWAYHRPYTSETERRTAFPDWLHHYNHHRGHTALGGHPPASRVPNLSGQCT